MALPSLNETPRYDLTIPSTGKKIKFRPYLVKEEKVLLMAAETKDVNQIMSSVIDTVVACTDNRVDPDELTTFDLEYMFIKIRSKSVGENVELNVKCESCDHLNKHVVDLDLVECSATKQNNIIQLTDSIAVEMRYPAYGSFDLSGDETALGFEILSSCIRAVLTDDQRFEIADEPKESVMQFLESMSKEQFMKVSAFLDNMPQVKMDIRYDCNNCGYHNEVVVQGMQGFF